MVDSWWSRPWSVNTTVVAQTVSDCQLFWIFLPFTFHPKSDGGQLLFKWCHFSFNFPLCCILLHTSQMGVLGLPALFIIFFFFSCCPRTSLWCPLSRRSSLVGSLTEVLQVRHFSISICSNQRKESHVPLILREGSRSETPSLSTQHTLWNYTKVFFLEMQLT